MGSESGGVSVAQSGIRRLVGFDTAGEPFLSNGRVLRGIYKGRAESVRNVLRVMAENDLFRHGVVPTRELESNPHPELDYETVLEHERIPFVTFPHEWSPSMFKEAALLHIALFERLAEHGLTLKDWHPQNILFSGTRPVFVDFTSIIPIGDMPRQVYLQSGRPPAGMESRWDATAKAMYESYRLMFEPYFGLPLAMMDRNQHARARQRMYETTLNASDSVITRREVFGNDRVSRLRYEFEERMLRVSLMEKGPQKRRFFRRLRKTIASRRAAHRGSAYSTYYEDKNEAFAAEPSPSWTAKQHGVHGALSKHHPATVLDLGSNTGWFSMLAAKLGASVVAVDLDEGSIDRLYRDAKSQGFDILPLVANLTAPLPELHPNYYEMEPSLSLIGEGLPLVSRADDRLECEMVMALALVHHLTLGQGLTFEAVAAILGGLSTKYLCVEFVEIDDPMVTGEPTFFPAYNADRNRFGWYNRDNFVQALRSRFTTIDIVKSHPGTRSLLVCSKAE